MINLLLAGTIILQTLVDVALPGTTIFLSPGGIVGNAVIDKPLTIVGAPGTRIVGLEENTPVLLIMADVTIRNLTISDAQDPCYVPPGPLGHGIMVRGSARVMLDSVRVENNAFNGIDIRDSARVIIRNSVISHNGYRGGNAGILASGRARVWIENCLIQDQADDGIQAWGKAWVIVRDSIIRNNKSDGVEIHDRARVNLSNVLLEDNALLAIRRAH